MGELRDDGSEQLRLGCGGDVIKLDRNLRTGECYDGLLTVDPGATA